jgi:hypothetical protein
MRGRRWLTATAVCSDAVYDPPVSWKVAVAATLAAACGSSPPPPPVALDEFSVAAQEALCSWAVRCRHMPDQATCERFIDPKHYDTRRAADAVAAGRLVWGADAAGACVAETRDAYCMAAPFSDASCDEYLLGQVGEGGPCTSDYECATGGLCEAAVCDAQCCAGTCGAPPEDPVDLPPRADIGEECATHADCVIEAYCEIDGVCTAMPDEAGERCLFGCARGDLFCDLEEFVCRAFASLGEACSADGASAPPCDGAYSFCDGECQPRPGAGEACDQELRRCIPTAYCGTAGECVSRGSAGAECTDSAHCDVACDVAARQCVAYETCETG